MDGQPLQNTSLQPTPNMKMNLKKEKEKEKKKRRMKPKGPKHWCGPMFLGWTKERTAKKEVLMHRIRIVVLWLKATKCNDLLYSTFQDTR